MITEHMGSSTSADEDAIRRVARWMGHSDDPGCELTVIPVSKSFPPA